MPGPFELIIILAIVVILFGVGKLPKVLGQMGKGVKAFKEGLAGNEIDDDLMDVTPDEEPVPPKAIDAAVVAEPAEEAQEVIEQEDKSA
jgi:sec-independent protein translocase protein TatA